MKNCWLGSKRGWARRVTRFGQLIDDTPDLYDLSFALLALAWLYRSTLEKHYLVIAHQTLDFIESTLAHPYGGFFSFAGDSNYRQQNPHMHLAEAMIAWMDLAPDMRFLNLANTIVGLLETRFYDRSTGALGEFFTADWNPAPGPEGQIVEPGHQLEWAWILCHHRRLGGAAMQDTAARLIYFARKYGHDPSTGLTVDQVTREGRILSSSHRLWPQTETLKGALAETEFINPVKLSHIDQVVTALFERFLKPSPISGTWIDHFNADGTIRTDRIPASSLYHICLAFFELMRLESKLV